MWMAWGPDLTFFCNAAYRRDTLGRKYPWALGRPASEVWAEIWDDIGPRIDRVLVDWRGHLGLRAAAVPRALRISGGDVSHVLLQPAARRRRTGRRHALCGQRGHHSRSSASGGWRRCETWAPTPAWCAPRRRSLAFADRQLGQNLRDLPFTLTYLFDDSGDARLAGTSGIDAGHPARPPLLPAGTRDSGRSRSRRAANRHSSSSAVRVFRTADRGLA